MEFRDDIKDIKKKYYNILKTYYKTSNLILKMIINNVNSSLSQCELNFRTCEGYNLSDKYINKLYNNNAEKAIHELRVRGISCIYTAYAIEDIIINNMVPSKDFVDLVNNLQDIIDELFNLATNSIKQSNDWAKAHNLPLLFEGTKITIEDMKISNRYKLEDINNY